MRTYHCLLKLLGLLVAEALCLGLTVKAADGDLRWRFTTLSSATPGAIVSSPSLGLDGTIYVGLEIGDAASVAPAGRVLALTSAGVLKWAYDCPDWVDSSPLVCTDGSVVFGCWDGKLRSLSADGVLKWEADLGGFIAGSAAQGPDGTLYVGSGAGALTAISPSGTILWTYLTADWIMSSPAIGNDGTIYVASSDRTLYALRPDGTEKWRYVATNDIVSSPSLAADGTVYFGSRDGVVRAITAEGTLRWTFAAGDTVDSSITLGAAGLVHFSCADGRVYCLSSEGVERWRYPRLSEPALQGMFSTPALRQDGSLVVGSGDGALLCLNEDGTLRWSRSLGDWADSSVLITEAGTLYIGCQDKSLYSFEGDSKPRLDDWGQHRRTARRGAWQPMGVALEASGRLINMSTRVPFQVGQRVSTGVWLNGIGTRDILVRAVGPGLAQFGISPVLPDPTLGVYRSGLFLHQNDNWWEAPDLPTLSTAMQAHTGFQLSEGARDAAVYMGLGEGGHTFEVNDTGTGEGSCLVELYDCGGSEELRLSNISARTVVGTGDNVLVAGFYLAGGRRTLLVRGVGPGLAPFLPGTRLLSTPRLRVFQGTEAVVEVAGWGQASNPTQLRYHMTDLGAFNIPDGSADAMLLVTLPAGGPYTVILDGVGGATGMGIVEVYVVE